MRNFLCGVVAIGIGIRNHERHEERGQRLGSLV